MLKFFSGGQEMRAILKWAWPLVLCFGAGVFAADGMDDVISMQNAGVSQDVMLAYVQNADIPYNLSADEIQSLQDKGVPATVVVAMIDRGKELNSGQAANAPAADASASAPAPSASAPADSASSEPVSSSSDPAP